MAFYGLQRLQFQSLFTFFCHSKPHCCCTTVVYLTSLRAQNGPLANINPFSYLACAVLALIYICFNTQWQTAEYGGRYDRSRTITTNWLNRGTWIRSVANIWSNKALLDAVVNGKSPIMRKRDSEMPSCRLLFVYASIFSYSVDVVGDNDEKTDDTSCLKIRTCYSW